MGSWLRRAVWAWGLSMALGCGSSSGVASDGGTPQDAAARDAGAPPDGGDVDGGELEPDCRTEGCPEGNACQLCPGPGGSVYACVPDGAAC